MFKEGSWSRIWPFKHVLWSSKRGFIVVRCGPLWKSNNTSSPNSPKGLALCQPSAQRQQIRDRVWLSPEEQKTLFVHGVYSWRWQTRGPTQRGNTCPCLLKAHSLIVRTLNLAQSAETNQSSEICSRLAKGYPWLSISFAGPKGATEILEYSICHKPCW